MTISIPRTPRTLSVTRSFFNANNSDFPDVDDSVLAHTVGDVDSYPTDMPAECAVSGLYSDMTWVAQGTAAPNPVGIEISIGEGHGTDIDFEVEVSGEGKAGNVTWGSSIGFGLGFAYEISNTESTFFQGSVASIPDPADFARNSYSYGIFAYTHTGKDGRPFTVVNYRVDTD